RDGQLYIAGLSGWQSNAARDGGFDRVRYTGKAVFVPTALHATTTGVSLTFTNPIDPKSAVDPDNYSVEIWNYRWTSTYGSADYSTKSESESARKKKSEGHDS